jgi:hypothetical protein
LIEREARYERFEPARLWRTVAAEHRKSQLRWALKRLVDDHVKGRVRAMAKRWRRSKLQPAQELEPAKRDVSSNA